MKQLYDNERKFLLLPTIIISLAVTIMYNPFNNVNINKFNRIFGNGVLNGIDISKRINSILIFDLVLIPIVLYVVWKILNKICENVIDNRQEAVKALDAISAIGILPILFAYINRFSNPESIGIEVVLPCFLILYLMIYLYISTNKVSVNFKDFKWCIVSAAPISIFFMLFFYEMGIFTKDISLFFNSVIFMIVYSFIVAVNWFGISKYGMKLNFNALKKSYLAIMIAPIITSVFIEFINILNQHNIFINFKFKGCLCIYIGTFLIFIINYKSSKDSIKSKKQFYFEKYYYPIILISLSLMFVQPNLQNVVNTDFFEQSNHGTSVNQLFSFGKIPLIETFDAHMLQNQVGSFIYGILNNDYSGAIFYGYNLLPVFVFLFYIVLQKFFNKDISFLVMLVFPILSDTTFTMFPLVSLVIIAFLYAIKHKSYKSYIMYWLSIAMTCLFRLDMGFSVAFATVATWAIVWFVDRRRLNLNKIFGSCIIVLASFAVVYFAICSLKDIAPISRIIEFLRLCQSNINWGYSSLGNISSVAFSVCYVIIPVIVMILLIKLIFYRKNNTKCIINNKKIIMLIIGLVSIFNLPRGMVRHSLAENSTLWIFSTAILFLCMYIYIFTKNNKLLKFSLGSFLIYIFSSLLITQNVFIPLTLSNKAMAKYLTFDSYEDMPLQKVDRVVLSDDMKSVYEPIKQILDLTLSDDETYIDFTNQTLLYALTNRKKPMYINQSPGLLSGEYTQKNFIEQCDKSSEKIPFVLMPLEPMLLNFELDGIQNSYRYYLVSEYLSNNFKPIFKTQQFAIWCRNDVFEEKLRLIDYILQKSKEEYVNVDYLNSDKLNGTNLDISKYDNNMILTSTSVDPILTGIENLPEIKNIMDQSKFLNISIDYKSDVGGIFELFYTTEKNEEFSPNNVVHKTMENEGQFNAVIPCNQYTKLRFDIPEGSKVALKNIKVKQELYKYNNDIDKIDYNYLALDKHTYNLGEIPYIWANFDEINIEDKKLQMELFENQKNYNFKDIDKDSGNYIHINSDSQNQGNMTILLGKNNDDEFIPLIQYNFQLKQGNKSDYLIRISSDFMWYSHEIDSIKVISDNNSKINKISILKGDTLK